MKKIKIIILATGDIAVPLLRALASDKRFAVVTVVTGADRPSGRKMEVKMSAIKEAAQKLGLPVEHPEKISDSGVAAKLRSLKPDLIVLMAYGQILPAELLEMAPHGSINVHVSLLPRWRGASPVQSAILAGDTETGISVMKMVAKMDAGPVYEYFSIPIGADDNAITVSDKLAQLAAEKTPEVLVQIAAGKKSPRPQDEGRATFCQKISKAEGQIDWNEPAEQIARRVRAYAGWPGTWTMWKGKVLKIIEGKNSSESHKPGQVTKSDDHVLVGTSRESLELITVQLEGKKALPIREFLKGHPAFIGSPLL